MPCKLRKLAHVSFGVMCIVLTDAKPSQTKIVLLPAQVDGKDWSCMLYTNDLRVTPGTPGLMIVAVPNPTQTKRFGLFDAADASKLIEGMQATFKTYEHKRRILEDNSGRDLLSFGVEGFDMAPVHEVGNYRISVAYNYAALMSSIDWSKFTLPPDFSQRLAALSDPSTVPAHAAFVVAEAVKSVIDDGFAVLFPGRSTWFPTCHERQAPGTEYVYDALLYAGDAAAPWTMWQTPLTTPPLTLYAGAMPTFRWSTASLPHTVRASDSSAAATMSVAWPALRSVTFTHVMGKSYRNFNVGEKLTADPVDAPVAGGAFTAAEFAELRARGSYYARGSMHYSSKPGTTVSCDACRANITAEPCIGHKTFDVCMACLAGAKREAPPMATIEPWLMTPAAAFTRSPF